MSAFSNFSHKPQIIAKNQTPELSAKLAALAQNWEAIADELRENGFAAPSDAARALQLEVTESESKRAELREYWCEHAKEFLAALSGRIDIFEGVYPSYMGYRSPLIERLRKERKLRDQLVGAVSPFREIQPLLIEYRERFLRNVDSERSKYSRVQFARHDAAIRKGYGDYFGFHGINDEEKYELLLRYFEKFLGEKFSLQRFRNDGAVFRVSSTSGKWDYFLLDESRKSVGRGYIQPMFGFTLRDQKITIKSALNSSISLFLYDNLIPGFRSSCEFAPDSYPEFCLAINLIAFLSLTLCRLLDEII